MSSSETRLSTDILLDVEGAIGTAAEDQFFGGARGEAFFGNGGDDYIEAAAGDDRLSFGVGQSLDSLVNFPGIGGSGIGVGVNTRERLAGSLLPQNQEAIASRLQRLDPYSATAGQAKATNTGLVNDDSGEETDWGSFLWGGAGIDTLHTKAHWL